jgi:protein arginine kinase activator
MTLTKKCQSCGKEPARNHYKRWENNRETELLLCDACAEKRGLAVSSGAEGSALANSLNIMLQDMEGLGEGTVGKIQCPGCGLLYSTFRETGRLGCSRCYEAFDQQLKPLLRRVHGSIRHTGKTPAVDDAHAARRRELRDLQEQMERAVGRDDFEAAAQLRDRIRALKADLPADRGGD